MARGRPVVVIQVALVLACVVPGSRAAFGQTGLSRPGISIDLRGLDLFGLAATTPTQIYLGGNGLNVTLSGVTAAGVITTAPAQIILNGSGLSATLPGVGVAGLVATTSTSINLNSKGASIALPAVDVAGVNVTTTSLGINLSGGGSLIDLSTVNVAVGGQQVVALPLGDVLQQVSQTQLFAGLGSAEVFAPIEQLLGGLAFGSDPTSTCATADAGALGPLPAADIWTWNASLLGRSDHDGYRVNGDGCRSTLPFQTQERASLPGVLWDASPALGLKKGTIHLGLSGGATETDTNIKPSALLRDGGFTQAGSARLRAWSVGGFALLTTDKWYAGTAIGGAWGNMESQNFVVGSASDYDTSTLVGAGFVGTIISITDTMRFDMRGTLSYQRTVGDAHIDTLGTAYGDHTIEAADAIVSGRLFGVLREGETTIRPFLQAGVTHHFRYTNQLAIDGVAFSLQEADTSVFAATGLDFEIDKTLQLSVGVRHDLSPDYESWTGRFGFVVRFN